MPDSIRRSTAKKRALRSDARAAASGGGRSQRAGELDPKLSAAGVARVLLAVGLGLEVQRAVGMSQGRGLREVVGRLLESDWAPPQ